METIHLLRNASQNNIKEYCAKYNEDYNEVWNYCVIKADEYNLKTPLDFYKDLYNLTLTFK